MAGDWSSMLGAALQQFGSSYGNYSQEQYEKKQEAERVKQALARQTIEDDRYAQQQKRQSLMDERSALEDLAQTAPFEAPLDEATSARFNAAGMGSRIGQRPATQTNIPSQFLVEGGEAQSVNPGAFLRPTLQQQQAQQQLYSQDPGVRQQLQIEQEKREQAEWERRNAIEARQRLQQIQADRAEPRQVGDPFLATLRAFGPSLVSQGVPPEKIAGIIRNMMGQTPQSGALGSFEGYSQDLTQDMQDMDADIQTAGGVANYLNILREKVAAGEIDPQEGDLLQSEAIARQRRKKTDINLP